MRSGPVVVVGCGPTGAAAAILLAQRGVDVLVLERRPAPYPLPRAVHFDDEVFRVFAAMGLAEQVAAISRPAPGMQLVDRRLRVLAQFDRAAIGGPNGFPQANMFDQPALEAVLRDRLAALGVPVLEGAEVTGLDGAIVSYGGGRIEAAAVLGCDGANSSVRGLIGATMQDLGRREEWMVVDVLAEPFGAYEGVQQVCDHDRAATFMPVVDGRYRWEFRNPPAGADVLDLIQPWGAAGATVVRQAWYGYRAALADRWSAGRVFLLGDAAHLTPPFIGQGMGAGIRDAANLAWKLAMVLSGEADDRLLRTYELERRPHARRMIRLASLVGWLMTGGSPRTAGLRRGLMRTVTRLPGVERRVLETALPTLPPGPLVARFDRRAGSLAPWSGRDQGGFHTVDGMLVRPDQVIASSRDDPAMWRRMLREAGVSPAVLG